jgi:hypothetical protein
MRRSRLAFVATLVAALALPAHAIDDKKIRQKIPPDPFSQEEADICAAVFFDASYVTREPIYGKLADRWILAASYGQGVEVKKYKGLIKNRLILTSWGPEVSTFYLEHCFNSTKDLTDFKTYVKHAATSQP